MTSKLLNSTSTAVIGHLLPKVRLKRSPVSRQISFLIFETDPGDQRLRPSIGFARINESIISLASTPTVTPVASAAGNNGGEPAIPMGGSDLDSLGNAGRSLSVVQTKIESIITENRRRIALLEHDVERIVERHGSGSEFELRVSTRIGDLWDEISDLEDRLEYTRFLAERSPLDVSSVPEKMYLQNRAT